MVARLMYRQIGVLKSMPELAAFFGDGVDHVHIASENVPHSRLCRPADCPTFSFFLKSTYMTDSFLDIAIEEAKLGLAKGGIPIGSTLVVDGRIVGQGHNQRVQKGSVIRHAEMDCLEVAGRLSASEYRRAILYSTLSPCDMCSGAILLYKIPKVIIGENRTFRGPEEYLRSRGVDITVMENDECVRLMEEFVRNNGALWSEDIGEESPPLL
jgi:creatinine deaminase